SRRAHLQGLRGRRVPGLGLPHHGLRRRQRAVPLGARLGGAAALVVPRSVARDRDRGGAARRLPPGARPDPGASRRLAPRPLTPARLVTAVCAAQVCAQIGAYTWPALLPGFIAEWHLTNREAGWITGIFYAAYTLSVPILVTLTDRVDARKVYLSGVALTIASHLGFAVLADGFWSAAVARALAGIGWAGTRRASASRARSRSCSRAHSASGSAGAARSPPPRSPRSRPGSSCSSG